MFLISCLSSCGMLNKLETTSSTLFTEMGLRVYSALFHILIKFRIVQGRIKSFPYRMNPWFWYFGRQRKESINVVRTDYSYSD
jgi:hypothetical protein